MLVTRFLTHPDWMVWVRMAPASVVDLCLRPSNWLWWTKLLAIVWNWRRSLIIFSNNFPIMLRRTIGRYTFGELYADLLGLGIMTIVDILKWNSQCPKSMHALAISKSLKMHSLFFMMDLIWLQVNLSGFRADKLLHFSIALMSSCLENKFQSFIGLLRILSSARISTFLNWAELKELWRACQKSSSSIHGYPLYWIALIARSLHFLIQFISSHEPHFLFAISLIFSSKKDYFKFLTMFLKLCQFLRLQECQYLSRESWQLLFHYALECFVILMVFECLCHNSSILDDSAMTASSRVFAFWIDAVFTFLIA